MKHNKLNMLTLMALLVALGCGLQIVESFFNIFPAVPGGKLGFANIATVITLYAYFPLAAIVVAAMRAFLGGLLFSGGISFIYSLCGALTSALTMAFVYKLAYPRTSFMGICIIGAVFHNLAQIALAAILTQSVFVFAYLPVLTVVSAISGTVTGLVSNIVIQAFSKNTATIPRKGLSK